MHICVSHRTALAYLLRMPCLRPVGARPSRASSVPAAPPSSSEAAALLEALSPNLSKAVDKLDILVSERNGCRQASSFRAHLCAGDLPDGSFISTDAMGISFHVCAPELVFLQMASELDEDQLIYVGYALCSEFRLDEFEIGGCAHREGWDAPLTDVERIRAYLTRLPERTRGRRRALEALEHVRKGARSPMEAGLAMVIGLPLRFGGHALGDVALNSEMRVYDGVDARGCARWVTRIPDILVTARDRTGALRRVGVDFDAKSTHMSPGRVAADVDRRNLMAPQGGFTHITIGSSQVRDYVALRRELDRIRRALGQRKKPRLKGNAGSERNRRIVVETGARQFVLWTRVLGATRFEL